MIKSFLFQKFLLTLSSTALFSATLLSIFIGMMKTSNPVNAASLYSDFYRICSLKLHNPDKNNNLDVSNLIKNLESNNNPLDKFSSDNQTQSTSQGIPESSQIMGIVCVGMLGLGILVKRKIQTN